MATYTVKKGDTAPSVSDVLLDASGNAVNLTGATVKFHMSSWDMTTVLINGSATGPNGGALDATGQVQYQWQAADVAAAGVYRAEWEVTFAAGAVETWPDDSYATVDIPVDLA
jgi:hypothetical protein